VVSDIKKFSHLKEPDTAETYEAKLVLINQRRDMIKFLNEKYGTASKQFLDVFEHFRSDPHKVLRQPNPLVKKLLKSTYERVKRQSKATFKFRNENMGEMQALVKKWWENELRDPDSRVEEVGKQQFKRFLLKKKIIIDEKELDALFKDLIGDPNLAQSSKISRQDFFRVFMRAQFRGSLQNAYEFIEKGSLLTNAMPLSLKVLSY